MLLRRVEAYLKRSGISPTRFGREVLRDPCFVFDLRMGRMPRERTVAQVDAFLRDAEQEAGPC